MKIPAWLTIAATKRAAILAAQIVTRIWTREQAKHIANRKAEERAGVRYLHQKKDSEK